MTTTALPTPPQHPAHAPHAPRDLRYAELARRSPSRLLLGLKVTHLDLLILALAATGLCCNALTTQLSFQVLLGFYFFGLLFEILTARLWLYNPLQLQSSFAVAGSGISLMGAAGWVGLDCWGLALARLIQTQILPNHPYLSIVVGVGIMGNLIEQLYHELGLFRYQLESPWIRLGFSRVHWVWGLPVSIRQAYFSSKPPIIALAIWIFSGAVS